MGQFQKRTVSDEFSIPDIAGAWRLSHSDRLIADHSSVLMSRLHFPKIQFSKRADISVEHINRLMYQSPQHTFAHAQQALGLSRRAAFGSRM